VRRSDVRKPHSILQCVCDVRFTTVILSEAHVKNRGVGRAKKINRPGRVCQQKYRQTVMAVTAISDRHYMEAETMTPPNSPDPFR
jgi:hypothetical protein